MKTSTTSAVLLLPLPIDWRSRPAHCHSPTDRQAGFVNNGGGRSVGRSDWPYNQQPCESASLPPSLLPSSAPSGPDRPATAVSPSSLSFRPLARSPARPGSLAHLRSHITTTLERLGGPAACWSAGRLVGLLAVALAGLRAGWQLPPGAARARRPRPLGWSVGGLASE